MTSPPAVPACPITTRLFEGGGVVAEGFGMDDIPRVLKVHPDAVRWLDLLDPEEDDLRAVAAEFELFHGLLDADLNEQSNDLNDVTRKLAAWAAIIAVPTALTGFFGQNVPYWGYERDAGFLGSTLLIVFSAGGLSLFLKRRGRL